MKILSQDQNQMVLKDGNISGLIIGVIFAIVGGYFFYHVYSTTGLPNKQIWIAAAMFILGLVVILFNSVITVKIDKSQNQIFFLKKMLIWSKSQTYNIPDALRVEQRKSYHMQSGTRSANGAMPMPREVLNYQSVIVFKDGVELPLESVKSAGQASIGPVVLMGGTGKDLSLANQVANFLGVPFQEIGPSSPPNVIGIPNINL